MAVEFTHFNEHGNAHMTDVSAKPETAREAIASGRVFVSADTFELIKSGGVTKGDVLSVARLAGVMGAKRTPDIIPLCHPIMLTGVEVELTLNEQSYSVDVTATTRCAGATGVEMEAITAVSVAALTVYDMCKAAQRDIEIGEIKLLRKSGGKSGLWERT
ncbi:MAG: cyclic pyranopterin monophosphate synthase MoaC [Oscillospiraceae bacterium]|nr:cyclic pyranopterin monophosphate synthase MoaC [Oscillospiraceae bacterium]